jgi:hypothetical protein
MPAPMKQPHWRTRLQRVALLVNPANFFHATAASQIAFEAIAQFPETDVDKADLESLIGDLMSGQYSDSVRVVASTPPNIGLIMRRLDLAGHELPASIAAFVDSHLGPDQLTLRLA